jgi:hypothetical protein
LQQLTTPAKLFAPPDFARAGLDLQPERGEPTMPKASSLFPSQFFRAADLDGERDVKIAELGEEYLFGQTEYVLYLEGEDKFLRLNNPKLVRDIVAVLDEDEMENWPGRYIKIYPSEFKKRDKDTGEEKIFSTIYAMKSNLDKPPPKPLNSPPENEPYY